MKSFCISNSKDLAIQMRISGVPSVYLKDNNEIIQMVEKLLQDEALGILMVSEELVNNKELPFKKMIEKVELPLVVAIPNVK